jgi:hypothetical protein
MSLLLASGNDTLTMCCGVPSGNLRNDAIIAVRCGGRAGSRAGIDNVVQPGVPRHVTLKMTSDQFFQSVAEKEPPPGTHACPRRIVVDAKGDCKEGDQGNAAYWYSRGGKPVCRELLDAEWLNIVRALLRH